MLCIHHDDLDGRASGAIVARRFPRCELLVADYRKFPLEEIRQGEELIIVDYSPPVDLWPEIVRRCHPFPVVWIDHHGSAIKDFQRLAPEVKHSVLGVQAEDACGARLSWLYFFAAVPLPQTIALVDRWDRHVFEEEDKAKVLNFAMGMEVNALTPLDPVWELLFADDPTTVSGIMSEGSIIVRYQHEEAARALANSYRIQWEGREWLVINWTGPGSRLKDEIAGLIPVLFEVDQPTNIMNWSYDGQLYTVHMYCEPGGDVSEIAKRHGGGGHPGAAGFTAKELPWEV